MTVKKTKIISMLPLLFTFFLGVRSIASGTGTKPLVLGVSLLFVSGCVLLFFSTVGIIAFIYNRLKPLGQNRNS
jgi:hypothetical protein